VLGGGWGKWVLGEFGAVRRGVGGDWREFDDLNIS